MSFQRILIFLIYSALLSVVSVTSFDSAEAAKILKVKGRKVLIDNEGEDLQKGDMFYVISRNGKKRGLIKILKNKGDKSIAKLGRRGRARRGWTLTEYTRESAHSGALGQKNRWGLLAGMGNNSMSIKIKNNNQENIADMSGSGFLVKGLYDYKFSKMIWFRGLIGMKQISVSSSDKFCGKTHNKPCQTDISYLTTDLWGRWVLRQQGSLFPWVGGGLSLLYPLSSETTTIEKDSIVTTSILTLGGGFDWAFGSFVIPFQVEYNMFPPSDEVETSSIAIQMGLLFSF